MPASSALLLVVPVPRVVLRQPSTPVGSFWQYCFWMRRRLSFSWKYWPMRSIVVDELGCQVSDPRMPYMSRSSSFLPS